jgi:PDZ domain-containing protein
MTEDHDPTATPTPLHGPGVAPGPTGVAGPRDPGAGAGGTRHAVPNARQLRSLPPTGRTRRRWWPWLILVVVAVAVIITSRIDLNYYALEPGTAQSVQQFITVPADKAHPVRRPVLLTDVEIGRVTALSYLYFELQRDTALEQVQAVTGGTPPSQLGAQGALEMSQAEDYAKVAALTHLGYRVPATPTGAVITGTFAGTPAYPVLAVGDVVTAVDGTPTLTASAFVTALHRYHSGQTVTLSVREGGTGPPRSTPVTLKTTVVNLGYNTNGKGPYATVDLGIINPEDQVDYAFPFNVSIDVTNIGGPSAGLAMTLGVIDALDGGSLTGGHTVAATGTIDAQGNVGDVGGVAQKTVAVENAGATIFLVPPQEYGAAMSEDRPSLKVYKVSTLDQALAVLAAHGGSVGQASPPQSTAPPSTPAG